jgi:hypothetical protein
MSAPVVNDAQILSRLHTVELKMRGLVEELSFLNRRVAMLEKEKEDLLEENLSLKSQLKESTKKETGSGTGFQISNKNRKLVENYFDTPDNPAELKEKIDQYIQEIDRCIAYLSSP